MKNKSILVGVLSLGALVTGTTTTFATVKTTAATTIEAACGDKKADGKTKEATCGDKKADAKTKEGKCGEGKCGDKKMKKEAKAKAKAEKKAAKAK
ncbi:MULTISPECIES: HvfA family oxazolone/thioamide-modified RiPP metallophore [Chryseobacterium]|jgi:uncharacterized low-complexity protein|uniref:HvfA family oxazolone/thioamide-modified RiPP metallophore n=1 Tax=Chryseobacterium TaxID=59732 RepID=UPI00068A624F|nr:MULTISPECIES: hypothetical protein [Chryseobacterium]MDR6157540.1 putative low-complexity protein [Chryseobacterium sp. SLBN-27]